jgi:hypothetical protein
MLLPMYKASGMPPTYLKAGRGVFWGVRLASQSETRTKTEVTFSKTSYRACNEADKIVTGPIRSPRCC